MEDIIIKSTPVTPKVEFRFSEGKFLIEGVIDPLDTASFFDPLLQKLKGYLLEDIKASELTIAPTFLRTNSIPYIKRLFESFADLSKHGQSVRVNWKCRSEDEALLELGKQLGEQTGVSASFE